MLSALNTTMQTRKQTRKLITVHQTKNFYNLLLQVVDVVVTEAMAFVVVDVDVDVGAAEHQDSSGLSPIA